MAENCSKSKLKLKKSSVEDLQTTSRGTLKRNHTTVFSGDKTAEPRRSVWWSREQLSAVEHLWALNLKPALQDLDNQHWDLVPDLPHSFTVRPTALTMDEQKWCDLSAEVTSLPQPSPPSPRTSSSPRPLRPGSCKQDLSVQTKPVLDPPDRPSLDDKTTALIKTPQPSLHSCEGVTPSARPSSVGGEEGRRGGEQEEETRPLNSRVSLQKKHENKEEVQSSVKGDEVGGGGALKSCPMCLLVFPAGFTQMDCDGHLAQCLSEVNVDVTW